MYVYMYVWMNRKIETRRKDETKIVNMPCPFKPHQM